MSHFPVAFLSLLHSFNWENSLWPKYFEEEKEEEEKKTTKKKRKKPRSHYISLEFGTCSSHLLLPTQPFGLAA